MKGALGHDGQRRRREHVRGRDAALLEERDALPETPLLAMIPVSVRTPEQFGTFGNKVSTMITPIPTDMAEPGERLEHAHEALRSRQGAPQGDPGLPHAGHQRTSSRLRSWPAPRARLSALAASSRVDRCSTS